jgi:protein TonB
VLHRGEVLPALAPEASGAASPISVAASGPGLNPSASERSRRAMAACLSLLLHCASLGLVLLWRPVGHSGTLERPIEAISVSIVDSSVLESRDPDDRVATAAQPAAVAAQSGEPDPAEQQTPEALRSGDEGRAAERRSEAAMPPGPTGDARGPLEAATEREAQASPGPHVLPEQPAPVQVPDPVPLAPYDLMSVVLDAAERDRQSSGNQRQHRESREAPANILEGKSRRASAEDDPPVRMEEPAASQRQDDRRHRWHARKGGAESRSSEGVAKSSGRVAASQGDIAGYAALVRARVAAHKPSGSGVKGTVTIRFGVSRSGAVSFAAIASSSGNPALDRAALSAVHQAAPFPSPPNGAAVSFAVPFTFQ